MPLRKGHFQRTDIQASPMRPYAQSLEAFIACYRLKAIEAWAADPGAFARNKLGPEGMAANVKLAIEGGNLRSLSIDGKIMQATCKELGIKPITYKSIANYLTGGNGKQA